MHARTLVMAGAAAAALLSVGVASASAPSKTTTLQSTVTVLSTSDSPTVAGSSGYTDSGVLLQPGATVTITATGSMDVCGGGCPSGPDGATNGDQGSGPVAGAPAGALVASAGGTSFQVVGASGSVTNAGASPAELYFAVDDGGYDGDNTGSYSVTVSQTVACTPGNGYGDKNHLHCGAPGQLSK